MTWWGSRRCALADGRALTSTLRSKTPSPPALAGLDALIDELARSDHAAILVMGKGGVGKTTVAAAIALGLSRRGRAVELTTTDPAGRWEDALGGEDPTGVVVNSIDPTVEVASYVADHLAAARKLHPERLALIEEDLKRPPGTDPGCHAGRPLCRRGLAGRAGCDLALWIIPDRQCPSAEG